MSTFIDKRKRSREDDALCDSTPLSKRINNLHLTNFEKVQAELGKDITKLHPNNKTLINDATVQIPKKLETEQNPGGSTSAISMGPEEQLYEPELSESQNPFYYVRNKLLHDLHLERIKRCPV